MNHETSNDQREAVSLGAESILGIDLGTNSVGWALLASPAGPLIAANARIFPSPITGNVEAGEAKSSSQGRTQARGQRKNTWRRAWRLFKFFRLLQDNGMAPPSKLPSGTLAVVFDKSKPNRARRTAFREIARERHEFLKELDRKLADALPGPSRDCPAPAHVVPFLLRAKGRKERLSLEELGRALFHLAQRRGFKGRIEDAEEDSEGEESGNAKQKKKPGPVKQQVTLTTALMKRKGLETYGEFFSSLNPEVFDPERKKNRIRAPLYALRKECEQEFLDIWREQARHHPHLTEDLRKTLRTLIIKDRDLKSQKHLIGLCELFPKKRRARMVLLIAQRYRILEQVNNLRLAKPVKRALTPQERQRLIKVLEQSAHVTPAQARKELGLPRGYTFSIEDDEGENEAVTELVGNRTAAGLREILGARWDELAPNDKDQLVEDIVSMGEDSDKLTARATREHRIVKNRHGNDKVYGWGLTPDQADKLCAYAKDLPKARSAFCRTALRELAKRMEDGTPSATVKKAIRDELGLSKPKPPLQFLPPVTQVFRDLRNPAVVRSLTELRHVVNEIIRKHGKPAFIRVELARAFKKTMAAKKRLRLENKEREALNKKAADVILKERGVKNPSRFEKQKVLLWLECDRRCPYTDDPISPTQLLVSGEVQVEHIIPHPICHDSNMRNLTLCFAQANQMKGKQTPFDAYGQSPRWPTILQRVEAFKGPFMEEKLKRFQMSTKEAEAEYSDFTNRHLSDTSYAAKLAKEYLGLLYGGEVDASGTRRVSAIRGALTYQLRKLWGLGTLFGRAARDGSGRVDGREQEKKYRGDHRHHALDAIVVALTDDATIKAMSDAAARGLAEHGAAGYARLQWRWPTFRDDIREHLSELNVSHRMDNSFCSAAPHAETFYSPPVPADHERYPGCKTKTVVFLRKTLGKTGPTGLKKDDVSRIVNPVVRARVEDKLKALGNDDPAKAFKDPATHPLHPSGKPIHRVRVWEPDFTKTIGGGEHARRVLSGDNHCLAVLREQDGAWAGQIVTRLEALRWKQAAEEAKRRTVAPPPLLANESRPLEFMLFKNDTIELDDVGGRGLFVVRFISQEKDTLKAPKVEYTPVNEARDSGDIKDAQKATGRRGAKILKTTGPEGLQKLRCEKVHIDPLGNIIFREGDGKRVRVQP